MGQNWSGLVGGSKLPPPPPKKIGHHLCTFPNVICLPFIYSVQWPHFRTACVNCQVYVCNNVIELTEQKQKHM